MTTPDAPRTEAGKALVAEYGVRPDSRFARAVKAIEEQAVADFSRRLSESEANVDRLWKVLEGIGIIENGTWVSFRREDAKKIAAALRVTELKP